MRQRGTRALKEHAWKLTPLARADEYQIPPTQRRLSSVSLRNSVVSGASMIASGRAADILIETARR
jgi:hypothetical protein